MEVPDNKENLILILQYQLETEPGDGAYKFRALVWDVAGNVAGENLVRIWNIDNTKPEPPTNLTAQEETGKIILSWNASVSPDIKTSYQYMIYRSTQSGGNYELLTTTSNTRYEDISITEGVTYYYVVTVTDKAEMRVSIQMRFRLEMISHHLHSQKFLMMEVNLEAEKPLSL